MAGKTTEKGTQTTTPVVESTYTREELAKNFKVFETSREIIAVALRLAGKDNYTLAEAKTIINKFKNKEVK